MCGFVAVNVSDSTAQGSLPPSCRFFMSLNLITLQHTKCFLRTVFHILATLLNLIIDVTFNFCHNELLSFGQFDLCFYALLY